MLPDVVKVTTQKKKRPRDVNKSKCIRSTENSHHSVNSGSVEPQIRVKKLNAMLSKKAVHTRSTQRTNELTSEAENPPKEQRKNDANSSENTRTKTNDLQSQLTECFVKLQRLTEPQIVDINRIAVSISNPHSSNSNDNANAKAADDSKVSEFSFTHLKQSFHVCDFFTVPYFLICSEPKFKYWN